MPVFKSGKGLAPEWCEMEYFEIIRLPAGASKTFDRIGQKETLLIGRGRCRVAAVAETVIAEEGAVLELETADGLFEVLEALSDCTLIRVCGHWGDETGGCGVYGVVKSDDPHDLGDPVDYPKETNHNSHYHDHDEYWILFEGRGIAVSEGKSYSVGPGDCVATGMGHHHDFPQVFEPVRAVYFETTLERRKRRGHLFNYKHGPAEPKKDRV